ncbi:hypothetical protein KDA_22010 [Dictyobacter alpinus]|uniref:Uncharacterized protein n=1 Tax=Dictyobacter alpinus TaxID=2014873 RepID=A0A402B5V8_9CHLR|nr:hypothetical protein [Dictyobacter alpinus]GCE26717.1 hypothetical protein KDA_22010 [Dictyobacter alpinus]
MKKMSFMQLLLAITSMCLLFLLTACTTAADTNNPGVPSATTPKATPTSETTTPKATPTSETTTPKPTPTSAAPALKTIEADSFTVGYPKAWTAQQGQGDTVIISYPASKANFIAGSLPATVPPVGDTVSQHLDTLLLALHAGYSNFKTYPDRHATIGGRTGHS